MNWIKIRDYIRDIIVHDKKWEKGCIADCWRCNNFCLYVGVDIVGLSSDYKDDNDPVFSINYKIPNYDPLVFKKIDSFIMNPYRYMIEQHNWEIEKTLKNLE